MECTETTWLSDKEYLQHFNKKAANLRIPLSGSIDITHQCNLRCVHCYLGPQSKVKKMHGYEMHTSRLLSIIDEITAAGCLFFLITGGEPFLRKDLQGSIKDLLLPLFGNALLPLLPGHTHRFLRCVMNVYIVNEHSFIMIS